MRSITVPAPLTPSPAYSENWREAGFGVYIHWPFCQAKCPYCDFNSHVARSVDQRRWAVAFASEIARIGAETQGRIVSSVFFGGGTPSLMEPETVVAVLNAVRATWPLANDVEITLEANPNSVEAGRFRAYRQAGVDRVSLGVQSLNDADLRALGRLHSAAEARAAVETAQRTFERVSFDLIYARQHQSVTAWRAELGEALALAADHLSLYQLTIEDGTAFGERFRDGRLRGLPTEDLGADLWEVTQEMCAVSGLPAYEVSNHARPGAEARHNLIYWRSGDWTGIGPGAHGRLTLGSGRVATEAARDPTAWLTAVERGEAGATQTTVPDHEWARECLMMGLRLGEGVSLDRLPALADVVDGSALEALIAGGFVAQDDDRIAVTSLGRPVLNSVLRALL